MSAVRHRDGEGIGANIREACAKGCKGRMEIFPEFVDGLCDLEGFSQIYPVYYFHLKVGIIVNELRKKGDERYGQKI